MGKQFDFPASGGSQRQSSSLFVGGLREMLDAGDPRQSSLNAIHVEYAKFLRGREIMPLGSPNGRMAFIQEGIAMRYRIMADGSRQVLMFLLPGDFCNLDIFTSEPSDDAIAAVTDVRVEYVAKDTVLGLLGEFPELNRALWIEAGLQSGFMRDRIISLGRCDARLRIALLLCELVARQVGRGAMAPIIIPIAQAPLADAVGLTHIHFNRVIGELCRLGYLSTKRGQLHITDIDGLRSITPWSSHPR